MGWYEPFNFHPRVEGESKQVVKPTTPEPKPVNTKQLAPITGALIAGLIGVQAADCYGWITSMCKAPNTWILTNYPACPNYSPGNDLYSTGAWTAYEAFEITEPGPTERARHADTRYCSGLATYLDCGGYPPPCEW